MKETITLFFLLFMLISFGQNHAPKVSPVPLRADKVISTKSKTAEEANVEYRIFDDFTISKYIRLSDQSLNPMEFKMLLGSFVRIQPTSITGDEINPMSFTIYEMEKMAKADYLFREFGVTTDKKIDDLPHSVRVHKTDHTACYGIIDLGYRGVVIPYKGALLFLIRK